ncbi:MAG: Uma2 family endonuclease, partial [Rudanella sp.]|nr:Uma2 family endonuclease [Rudanella sp.]
MAPRFQAAPSGRCLCFFAEADVHLEPDTYRRPDAAFLTKNQIDGSENEVKYAIPSFVIEVISPNDRVKYLEEKLQEYFDAGVQIVWHIFPNTKQVWVYTDPLHHIVHS